MGNYLDKPITKKTNQISSGNGMRCCVSSMQGWRQEMEDAHTVHCQLDEPLEAWGFFGVFDGHAGAHVSNYCSKNLLKVILNTEAFINGHYADGIRDGFFKIDKSMRLSQYDDRSGSTAVCVFITPDTFYFANCGDSRAVLSRSGKTVFCTFDHKPTVPSEMERIQKAGGCVMVQRVNGTLSVSRALGDYDFKNNPSFTACRQLVSPEPELFTHQRADNDEFLVLACDGIWDVFSNDEVCSFISSQLLITEDLTLIVDTLLEVCLFRGSRDNMTILLVTLPGVPKVDERAIKENKRLEQNIDRVTREVIKNNHIIDFEMLMRLMIAQQDDIPNLPPGCGLFAKHAIIKQVFREIFPEKSEENLTFFAIRDDINSFKVDNI